MKIPCLAACLPLLAALAGCGGGPEELLEECREAERDGAPAEELVRMYERAAEAGSAEAAVRLAYDGLDRGDCGRALGYAARFKDAFPEDRDVVTGLCYLSGESGPEREKEGEALLKGAAARNVVRVFYPLGEHYLKRGEYAKAARSFARAAAGGDNRGRWRLVRILKDGLAKKPGPKEAFGLIFREQKEAPRREADLLLAECYLDGFGTPANPGKARELIRPYVADKNDSEAALLDYRAMLSDPGAETAARGLAGIKDLVAAANYGPAAYFLYKVYAEGLYGLPADRMEAVHYARAAEKAGYPKAYAALAEIYMSGSDVTADPGEAFSFAKRGIELAPDDPEAAYIIGKMYAEGIGTKKDDELAAKYLKRAAAAGVTDAEYRIGMMLYEGRIASKYDAEAVDIFRRLADEKYPPAALRYGEILYLGTGVERNLTQAIRYLTLAADAGQTEADFTLASALDESGDLAAALERYEAIAAGASDNAAEAAARAGEILYEQDKFDEAEKYFAAAAAKGHLVATENLGRIYYVNGDYDRAREQFLKIAGASAYAQTFLGMMYDRGQGVPKNDVYASEWYEKAMARGSTDAMYLEAVLINNSVTLPDEMKENVEGLLKNAACAGHHDAIVYLGDYYYASLGHYDLGLGWLALGAEDFGYDDAGKLLRQKEETDDLVADRYARVKEECRAGR